MQELGEKNVASVTVRHANQIFKQKNKQQKIKKTKEEKVRDRVERRLANQSNVNDHIKSYSVRKAPLYNK